MVGGWLVPVFGYLKRVFQCNTVPIQTEIMNINAYDESE